MEREEMDKIKNVLEDARKKLVDVYKKGKGEADRVTKLAQVKIEIGSLKRQRKDLFEDLGENFYKNYKKPTEKGQTDIAEIITHIGEVDKRVGSLKRELKSFGTETKAAPKRRGRPPKAKTETPKRRGRPPKAKAPKKRGRPPKAKAEAPKRRGRPPKAKAS